VLRRATIALALLAALAWSCLLFGIGLDDLTNGHTRPGVISAIVLLCLVIAGLLYAIWRVVRPHLAKRLARR
jgi:hypothetical protein